VCKGGRGGKWGRRRPVGPISAWLVRVLFFFFSIKDINKYIFKYFQKIIIIIPKNVYN
jgi:hypothetical protein